MELNSDNAESAKAKAHYSLPKLPYSLDALEPVMSEETLRIHYGKHHKGYVDKLNQLIRGTEFESMRLEDVIRKSTGSLFNNAAQVWNHSFFWNCLTPFSTEPKSGKLFDCISHCFSSMTEFKLRFAKAGEDLFGSGYVWLVKDGQNLLDIKSGSNAYNPMTDSLTPIFTVDVWEHAYYLDHLNARKEYLKNIWQIANWEFVDAMYSS